MLPDVLKQFRNPASPEPIAARKETISSSIDKLEGMEALSQLRSPFPFFSRHERQDRQVECCYQTKDSARGMPWRSLRSWRETGCIRYDTLRGGVELLP